MDIVIPLGKGSPWHDNELRYSLRSLEKYAKNFGAIILVGENKPDWITNVLYIEFAKPTNRNHEHNIYEKMLFACQHILTDNFMAWQDDYFLLAPIDCDNYPYYYNRPLIESVRARMRYDGYATSLDNSRKQLLQWGCETFNYDIHCPMIINKQAFMETVGAVDWATDNGFVIKSLYANSKQAQALIAQWNQACAPQQMADLKINHCNSLMALHAQLQDRHIFSLSDKGLTDEMKEFLKNKYPTKSKYEK